MSIRMSFDDTPNWREAIGFQNRLSLRFRITDHFIIIQKGGLVYGFRGLTGDTFGYLVDNDEELSVPAPNGVYYITLGTDGLFRISIGSFSQIRGIGANVPGIPWYTHNNRALVGKVFKETGIITNFVVCDDPYWCEFEGTF